MRAQVPWIRTEVRTLRAKLDNPTANFLARRTNVFAPIAKCTAALYYGQKCEGNIAPSPNVLDISVNIVQLRKMALAAKG